MLKQLFQILSNFSKFMFIIDEHFHPIQVQVYIFLIYKILTDNFTSIFYILLSNNFYVYIQYSINNNVVVIMIACSVTYDSRDSKFLNFSLNLNSLGFL